MRCNPSRFVLLHCVVLIGAICCAQRLCAQSAVEKPSHDPSDQKTIHSSAGESSGQAHRPTGSTADHPEQKPTPSSSESHSASKPETAKTEKSEPKVTARPMTPAEPPDPNELRLVPDSEGRVRFNWKGQPWPDVLEWLADTSKLSLDWQELPADYLNLVTQHSYTLDEARDLINRHLLARGFTLLRDGEILSVVKLDKLNPAMVPRVAPEDLVNRDPHEFVRVSFELDWMLAENAAKELGPMLSPNGKLTNLTATNRLEAIDVVLNLLEIYRLLAEEQSPQGQDRLVKEFPLRYTRATDVLEQLETLLGIEKKKVSSSSSSRATLQQMQAMQQQMARMAQQKKPTGPSKPATRPEDEIRLLANDRQNSLLAHAPPDKMAVIEQAVLILDVPAESLGTPLENGASMQTYRLAAIDPTAFVELLQEVGNLEPTTRIQVDKTNKALIVFGSRADHLTIQTLIEKLDGSSRQFHVMPLRKLDAEYVAGTIRFMMTGEEGNTQPRVNDYYSMRYGSSRRSEEPKVTDKFRVDADVEYNKLLLWANEIELKEVENLLVKLGEMPSSEGNPDTVRIIESVAPEDADEFLQRIQKEWPRVGPNPLFIEPSLPSAPRTPAKEQPEQPATPAQQSNTTTGTTPEKQPVRSNSSRFESRLVLEPAGGHFVKLAQLRINTDVGTAMSSDESLAPQATPEDSREEPTRNRHAESSMDRTVQSLSPIVIRRSDDGRLIITSRDTRALDRLEDLMTRLAPPRRDYKVFQLKYPTTWAYSVVLNLEEFFKEDSQRNDQFNYFAWRYGSSSSTNSGTRRLSERRPLKFIPDEDSHTILVQGADSEQLKVIEDLINLYDQPVSEDSQSVRKTKIIPIQYSKAQAIAQAIKDVYRDLLSPNDKAAGGGKSRGSEQAYTWVYNYGSAGRKEPPKPLEFQGFLSIGVDELSNALIVSAPESLLGDLEKMIADLDEAARPTSAVGVLPIDRRVNSTLLQSRLEKIFGRRSGSSKSSKSSHSSSRSSNR